MPGPRTAFKPEEVTKLKAYAARGGPLIVLVGNSDPRARGIPPVLQPRDRQGPDRRAAAELQSQPVQRLRGRRRRPTQAPDHQSAGHKPLRADTDRGADPALGLGGKGNTPSEPVDRNLVPMPFLETSAYSWLETDLANPAQPL